MTLFEVWVPEKTVKLRVGGEDREMERGDDGWWRLDDGWLPPVDETGAAKLLVTSRTLRLRRQRPELFGPYRPVFGEGRVGEHLLAFDRGGVVTVATRLPVGLSRHGGWDDAALSLDGHSWTEVFTNTSYGGNRLAVSELLRTYPVALLVKE